MGYVKSSCTSAFVEKCTQINTAKDNLSDLLSLNVRNIIIINPLTFFSGNIYSWNDSLHTKCHVITQSLLVRETYYQSRFQGARCPQLYIHVQSEEKEKSLGPIVNMRNAISSNGLLMCQSVPRQITI